MAFDSRPDLTVPDSEFRCEAMTKPYVSWQKWCREPHRCVRHASQSRAGHIVCSTHAQQKVVTYWNGAPDSFVKKVGPRRYRVPAGVGISWE